MARGIHAAFSQVVAIIEGVTPTRHPDWGFTVEADGRGRVTPIEKKMTGGFTRYADLVIDDGGRGNNDSGIATRRTVQMELRVIYGAKHLGDLVDAKLLALDDAPLIEDALSDPRNYDGANSGIDSLYDISSTVTAEPAEDSDSDDLVVVVAAYTFSCLYRRN